MAQTGFFITLEGPDGCGKTTQSLLLVDALRKKGLKVVHSREPGGTSFAENLRRILLNPKYKILPLAELLLYEASRAQHTDEVIRPAMKAGKIVVCERYADATFAYQGYGRRLNLTVIEKLNEIATAGLKPNLTIVLDIPPALSLSRKKVGSQGKRLRGDRLERENSAFHSRVRKGYFELTRREPRRIKIVSAIGSVPEVHQRIWKLMRERL